MELYNPGAPFVYTSAWNPTRVHPVTGQVRPHRGEDWGAPSGTPIPAAGDGKVVFKDSMSGYGYVVVLEHANGTEIVHTLYAHMSTASPLALGSAVVKGASVGPCGSTGIGTGAHLHFEVLRNGTRGHPNLVQGHATVNPRGFDISGLTHPDGETSTDSSAAPVEQPTAAGATPSISFQYPFRKADGKQFADADEIYKALESEASGHYLLGSNKFWHGGIHISDKSAPQCVLNEPIRCIADGEVVAYRLNQDYLESTFGENEKKLKYSNSFCLVRHEYKSVPNPEEGPNKGKQNKLTFYSLYMHLLPYERYPLAPEEKPKPIVTMAFGDYRAYDKAKWTEGASIYGLIQQGTKLEIIEETSQGVETFAKGKILSGKVRNGSSTTRNVGDEIWFAYKQNDAPWENSAGKKIWTADHVPERLRPNYWQGKVQATLMKTLNLREAPTVMEHGQPAGSPIGNLQLIPGSVVEFDSEKVLNLNVGGKIRRMAQCTLISGGPAGSGAIPPNFWACVENLPDFNMMSWTSLKPSTFDSVVMGSAGIKAGDPIGYLGLMENLTGEDGGISSKHQVHVEVFTADAGIKDFLQNTAGLKTGKQYLQLPSGTKLKIKGSTAETSPLQEEHVIELAKAPIIKESEEDWYEVSLVDANQNVTGLIKKTTAQFITQHDWARLGFKIVEETNTAADGFLDTDDMPQFFKDLLAKIDKNNDGDITSSELAEALKNSETRDQWSKLIAYHPTEWKEKSDSAKWGRLDELLEASPKTLRHEKERIDKLVFWDDLSGKAAVGASLIWHFHPMALVGNFSAKTERELITRAMLKAARPSIADDYCDEILPFLNKYAQLYSIDTPLRIAHLLAQVGHESGFKVRQEDLSYSAVRMRQIFGCRNNQNGYNAAQDECIILPRLRPKLWSEAATYAHNPLNLGSYVYANRNGNGDETSQEGYKFRGRGIIQLTGKNNYREYTRIHNERDPSDPQDFVANPDLIVSDLKYGIESAFVWWDMNRMNNYIATSYANRTEANISLHVADISTKVNGGTIGLAERVTLFNSLREMVEAELEL